MAPIDSVSTNRSRIPRKFIVLGFSLTLFVCLSIILVLGIQIKIYSKELNRLKRSDSSAHKEQETIKQRVAELESEIAELVQSRIPSLKELTFDQVVPIDRGYIKNIVFTITGKNGKKHFEFKTVLKNRAPNAISPNATVNFFDRLGIQIGRTVIDDNLAGSDKGLLEPGEIRSYYDQFSFPEDRLPRYFRIDLESPEAIGRVSTGKYHSWKTEGPCDVSTDLL